MLNTTIARTVARIAIAASAALGAQAFAAVATADNANGPAATACPQLAQQLQSALGKVASEQSKAQEMSVRFKVTDQGVKTLKTSGAPSLHDSFAVRRAMAQLQCDTKAFAGQEFAINLNLNPNR